MPLFFLLALAAAAPPDDHPIMVTGHSWAPFISPFGEPFRAKKTDQDTMGDWFRQADRDQDGLLTPAEMRADGERFFALLDGDGNGLIEPEELVEYEWEVAPEIQVGSRWRAPSSAPALPASKGERPKDDSRGSDGSDYERQGAGRYALLNIPEPVASADANFDRAISLAEFRQAAADRFRLLDGTDKGQLSFTDMEALRPPQFVPGSKRKKRARDATDARVGQRLPISR
ncbi:MAG: EF-hand domain-containing protein [Pseudomonadota bacterium]